MQSFSVVLATVYTVGCKDWKYNNSLPSKCWANENDCSYHLHAVCYGLISVINNTMCWDSSKLVSLVLVSYILHYFYWPASLDDPSYVPPIRLSVKCNSTHSILAVSKIESDSLDYLQLEYTCSNMTSNVTVSFNASHNRSLWTLFCQKENNSWKYCQSFGRWRDDICGETEWQLAVWMEGMHWRKRKVDMVSYWSTEWMQ